MLTRSPSKAWTYPASLLYNHFQLETSLGIGIFLVYSTLGWRSVWCVVLQSIYSDKAESNVKTSPWIEV